MSKSGTIIVELAGKSAPEDLTRKVLADSDAAGVILSVDGSIEVLDQAYNGKDNLPKADDFIAERGTVNDHVCVSWWGYADGKERFTDAEVQPYPLLADESGNNVLMVCSEGDTGAQYIKPKVAEGAVYHFHEALKPLIEEMVDDCEGDLEKILGKISKEGGSFDAWWNREVGNRFVSVFISGQNRVVVKTKGNDQGIDALNDWGYCSNTKGWSVKAAAKASTAPLTPAQRLAARRSGGQSAVVSAQTDPKKMTSAEQTVAAAKRTMLPPVGHPVVAAGSTVTASSSEDDAEDDTVNLISPPEEYIKAWKQAKKGPDRAAAQQKVYEWYREHNGGIAPDKWTRGSQDGSWTFPEIKAGQERWIKEDHEPRGTQGRHVASEQATVRPFSSGAPAAKGGTKHIRPATTADQAAVEAIANNPAYDAVRKQMLIDTVLNDEPMLDTLGFDGTKSITMEEISNLDRPKAPPWSVFNEAGILGIDGMRWGHTGWQVLQKADPNFIIDVVQQLRYENLVLRNAHPEVVIPQGETIVAKTGKILTGAAAKLAALGKKNTAA